MARMLVCWAQARPWQAKLRAYARWRVRMGDPHVLGLSRGSWWRVLASLATLVLLVSVSLGNAAGVRAADSRAAEVSVFASGLDNPRGLKFGPDGSLYVAEGGSGGTTSTVGQCDQVPAPVGPYTAG